MQRSAFMPIRRMLAALAAGMEAAAAARLARRDAVSRSDEDTLLAAFYGFTCLDPAAPIRSDRLPPSSLLPRSEGDRP